ncbi:uncharacterized protein LOC129093159 [Anoplopoma fimbria]|uniref:uncharacterized protein LOC129093159 n=1 Tax=Anoplopoma fimbria TaxID=229290 RepID=UPI0023ECEECD|nr:uncharacterized protein LOC129093159 [Anoplopoma fimbria]
MKNFTLITALSLCSFISGLMSVSVSEFKTVEVQAGGEVTLQSAKMSNYDSVIFWFRLVNRSKASCISVMINSGQNVSYYEGFRNEKFEMRTNITTVSLKIQKVDLSDSGIYFCVFYQSGRPQFSVIHLNVKGSGEPNDDGDNKCKMSECQTVEVQAGGKVTLQSANMSHYDSTTFWFRLVNTSKASCISVMSDSASDGMTHLSTVILAGLTVFLVMVIIGLAVRNRKLQTGYMFKTRQI